MPWKFELLTKPDTEQFITEGPVWDGEQILFTLVIMALMAAAFVITEAMIGAIIVCLSGPCEFGALVAVMGFAAALIVIGVIKASKGSSAGPNAAAGGGDTGENAPA